MPMARAVKQCPDLIIVPSHYQAYQDASRQVMTRLHDLTPLVEQISIDEAFLDVSDLSDPVETLARNLQATINNELGLPCSLGVATNKLVAKIANNVGKASAKTGKPPNTIKVIGPGQEAAFLAPLPVRELWGVGPKTGEQLAQLSIHTIGDLAQRSEVELGRRFGKLGHDLARRAKGIDDRPVETEHEAKSISQETTFAQDIDDGDELRQVLRRLSEQVGRRLRKRKLSGTTVKIKLRWADFTTLTRQVTLDQPTNLDIEIYAAIEQLFGKTWPPGKRVRLVGVGVSGFEPQAYQLGLWDKGAEQGHRLQDTLDDLRDRFGDRAIQRGNQLKKND
jgi:nucleotidyltransferase/DNA polymerase involved in DNA repair